MLIHLCTECESLSINRIAADDVPQTVFNVYAASFRLDTFSQTRLDSSGIRALTAEDGDLVRARLFGGETDLAELLFSKPVYK